MDVKKLALLVGALVIAVVTAVMAKNMFAGAGAQQAAAAPAVPVGPKIVVAKKALPAGTIIDPDSFTLQPWPKELMQSAYYVEGQPDSDPKKLIGTVVRYPITAGQPVTRGSLVGPGDRGFLAAALGPGMRAITVPVNVNAGVAGFVFPGDHVDLVLTQQVQGGGDGPPLKVAETIIRNLRVLATDQRISGKDDEGKTVVKTFSNVTLEVTPRIAEKIAVAQSLGSLSLSLRSIADNAADLEREVASGQIKIPAGTSPDQEKQMLLAMSDRPIDTNTTFSTGADVSRFQRRSVPAKAAAAPASGQSGASAAPAMPVGPVVRIARGNSVTVVPVGAR
jgi:pilus assembly protein CpaB